MEHLGRLMWWPWTTLLYNTNSFLFLISLSIVAESYCLSLLDIDRVTACGKASWACLLSPQVGNLSVDIPNTFRKTKAVINSIDSNLHSAFPSKYFKYQGEPGSSWRDRAKTHWANCLRGIKSLNKCICKLSLSLPHYNMYRVLLQIQKVAWSKLSPCQGQNLKGSLWQVLSLSLFQTTEIRIYLINSWMTSLAQRKWSIFWKLSLQIDRLYLYILNGVQRDNIIYEYNMELLH